jgi:hypothetical protein
LSKRFPKGLITHLLGQHRHSWVLGVIAASGNTLLKMLLGLQLFLDVVMLFCQEHLQRN